MLIIIISLSLLVSICSFKYQNINQRRHLVLYSNTNEEYTNNIAKFLSSFLPNAKTNNNFNGNGNLLDNINWNETKRKKTSISTLSKDLEKELYKREWFVTGINSITIIVIIIIIIIIKVMLFLVSLMISFHFRILMLS